MKGMQFHNVHEDEFLTCGLWPKFEGIHREVRLMQQDLLEKIARTNLFIFLQERTHEKQKMFGKMDLVPVEQFMEIYHKTGIDVDGRIKTIISLYSIFETCCQRYIQYAQELPGFQALSKEDQVTILKSKDISEQWVLDLFSGGSIRLIFDQERRTTFL